MKIKLTRLSAGNYSYLDRYYIHRMPDGSWRWQDGKNLSYGGEWRGSKREAVADLAYHLRWTRMLR